MISSNMELHALRASRVPRAVTTMTMLKQYLFRYQDHVGVALALGVERTSQHLHHCLARIDR